MLQEILFTIDEVNNRGYQIGEDTMKSQQGYRIISVRLQSVLIRG